MLRRDSSISDCETFTSNAILTGNNNSRENVQDYYNEVKEFFITESDTCIVAASMRYFGMENKSSMPMKNGFPELLKKAPMEDQRKWIHTHINKMIEEFVMDSVTDINKTHESVRAQVEERNVKKQYPCRSIGCKNIFRYEKCRSHHVQQRHELRFEQEKNTKSKQ